MARAHLCLSGMQVWRCSARKTGKAAGSQAGNGEERVPLGGGPQGRCGQQAVGKRCCFPAPGPEGCGHWVPNSPLLSDLGSDPGSLCPHLVIQRISGDIAPILPGSRKRFSSSNCQRRKEVLLFVCRTGLGVTRIPAAAGARNPAHPTSYLNTQCALLVCGSSFRYLVPGRAGVEKESASLRELVRGSLERGTL